MDVESTLHAGTLEQKERFYANLDDAFDALDSSDDAIDAGRAASVKMLKQGREASSKAASDHRLPRSISETNLAAKSKNQSPSLLPPSGMDAPSRKGGTLPANLTKGSTFSGAASVAMVKPLPTLASRASGNPLVPISAIPNAVTGKRKRPGIINLVPEEQQVFKGMHFYFFPDNDNHPARRMRITKALEFGATWQKQFNDIVTHVIVDKHLSFDQLLKHLKMDELPGSVVVASEAYPPACTAYRSMLDPSQPQFAVRGYVQQAVPAIHAVEKKSVTSNSDPSLELKPAGKLVMARQPETPRTTDEAAASTQSSLASVQQLPGQPAPTSVEPSITNELDAAIKSAKELQHVPLDEDDSRPTSSSGYRTDDETSSKQRKARSSMQDKFQCMQKHTGDQPGNPNAGTIAILQQMAEYYGQMGDEWRIRAYRKAIASLRNHRTKVTTKEEAVALPQIGERLAAKIEEIAITNRLRRLDSARAEPTDQVLQTFMKVYGAGLATASDWVGQGFKTLDELLEKADLTDNQRIGIDHYEDFNSRIPRAEVEQHGAVVRKALQKIDPAIEVIVGGSYRRGSKDSGDIDCIITRPNTSAGYLKQLVLDKVVPQLFRSGFLVASLAATSRDDGSKWHGASRLPASSIWRRMDLLLVPSDELGAALIYFTGNDIFNRSLRLLASKKGMRLNQRGLYKDVVRGNAGEKLGHGTLIEGKSEKRIFEVLSVPWRPPEHRIC